jgi:hypothetical protein
MLQVFCVLHSLGFWEKIEYLDSKWIVNYIVRAHLNYHEILIWITTLKINFDSLRFTLINCAQRSCKKNISSSVHQTDDVQEVGNRTQFVTLLVSFDHLYLIGSKPVTFYKTKTESGMKRLSFFSTSFIRNIFCFHKYIAANHIGHAVYGMSSSTQTLEL